MQEVKKIQNEYNCLKKEEYEFVRVNELKTVYPINQIQNKPNKVYRFFMENAAEILYLTDDNGIMCGLISIGDMYRYYRNEEKYLPINQNFSYVQSPSDYKGAEAFFEKVKIIHEIPVIKDQVLLGVIQKSQYKEWTREPLKNRLRIERRSGWQRKKLEQFNQAAFMPVMYYDLPRSEKLPKEDERALNKRKKQLKANSGQELFERLSKEEQKKIVGKHYHERYVEQFLADYKELRIYQKNGVYELGDCCNETFHIVNGYRQISNAPKNAKRKIWIFGPCTVFGRFVKDDETIEYYLQNYLLKNGYDNYEVINVGMRDEICSNLFTEKMSSDDIVIIAANLINLYNYWGKVENKPVERILNQRYKGDLSEVYAKLERPLECVLDSTDHCNYMMNEKIAERMFADICPKLSRDNGDVVKRIALQDYFIPWDVIEYYECYMEEYGLVKETGKTAGAIVMNCNPFTLGHRYLAETACKYVDILYVFVVEEDRSYFKFEDRLEMVRQGMEDLKKVRVLPSGRYIISKETFAQYFDKDQIVSQIDDTDYDVRIFGEVVADMFGISCRFVGEEPFDIVTKEYNETMKRILPEYGIELIEIPRREQQGSCISASRVRHYLESGEKEKAYALVPESTREHLDKMKIYF